MMDLQEARAAVIAARELSNTLPIIVTITCEVGGRTLTGTNPISALVALQSMNIDAFGLNCSAGPDEMLPIIQSLKPYANIPLVAKANAGMPKLVNNKTVFELSPEDFASKALKLADAGAGLLGGCCGTTPQHIKALNEALGDYKPKEVEAKINGVISSSSSFVEISSTMPLTIIGERINPTGKKAFQAELRSGSLDMAASFARTQTEQGAQILDVNFGLAGIDQTQMMKDGLLAIMRASTLPLCIDSTNPETVEAALRYYPGRALLNSISLEKERIEKVLPIAAKYGAMLILLPLSDDGIPNSASERIDILEKIIVETKKYNYQLHDCVVDALILTVSADSKAALSALEFIEKVTFEKKMATVCGLSNVSFGLPSRAIVNATFLAMAAKSGLTMAIANPEASNIMDTVRASNVLLNKDPGMKNFISFAQKLSNNTTSATTTVQETVTAKTPEEKLFKAILDADNNSASAEINNLLASNKTPGEIVNTILIPALTEVGSKFEKKEYFLPQLMNSASTMSSAMAILEPLLAKNTSSSDLSPVFVMATVEGDIHDIGKNIVTLLLKNHNFKVFDLGKDVKAETIVKCAIDNNAQVIGLSALMTTTMPKMQETLDLLKENNLDIPVIVGGAAVDASYAQSIGAYFGEDAMDTVRIAQKLTNNK
jgi:5-methyltetrahydrofolate--homocysteine methyltransferase